MKIKFEDCNGEKVDPIETKKAMIITDNDIRIMGNDVDPDYLFHSISCLIATSYEFISENYSYENDKPILFEDFLDTIDARVTDMYKTKQTLDKYGVDIDSVLDVVNTVLKNKNKSEINITKINKDGSSMTLDVKEFLKQLGEQDG